MASQQGAPASPDLSVSTPKLRRARELYVQYLRDSEEWVRSGLSLKGRVRVGRAELEFARAPEALVLVIGDCIQNLRSALDHEIYRIALARHDANWSGLSRAQFPFTNKSTDFDKKGGQIRSQIQCLTEREQNFVRSMQPFMRPRDPFSDPLATIHRLAIVDRHRTLNVAAMQPQSVAVEAPHWERGQALPRLPITLNCEIRFVDVDAVGVSVNVLQVLDNGLAAVSGTISRLRRVDGGSPGGH